MTYTVSNETAQTSQTFTSKRAARKRIAELNRAKAHYQCYIYDSKGNRADRGTIDAKRRICA